jgi:FkbM family methyltransferase
MGYFRTENENQIPDFDKICTEYFGNKTDGFVLDVGAHDGFRWSNSYPLISKGWNGVLIEPHPLFADKIRELYKNRLSDGVIVVEKAISNYKGEAVLYDAFSLTTLKTQMLDAYEKIPWAAGHNKNIVYNVKVDILDDVLNENNVKPNFEVFTLDCEGSEEEVLENFNIDYWKPQMVMIETLEKKPDNERTILDMKEGNFYKFCDDLFIGKGYKKIYADHINTIYTL